MKHIFSILSLTLLLGAFMMSEPAAAAKSYTLTPENTNIKIVIELDGQEKALFNFEKFNGEFNFDESNPGASIFRAELDTSAVTSEVDLPAGFSAEDIFSKNPNPFIIKAKAAPGRRGGGIEGRGGRFVYKGPFELNDKREGLAYYIQFSGDDYKAKATTRLPYYGLNDLAQALGEIDIHVVFESK